MLIDRRTDGDRKTDSDKQKVNKTNSTIHRLTSSHVVNSAAFIMGLHTITYRHSKKQTLGTLNVSLYTVECRFPNRVTATDIYNSLPLDMVGVSFDLKPDIDAFLFVLCLCFQHFVIVCLLHVELLYKLL